MTTISEYRSGTGKVIGVGDFISIDGRQARYRVTSVQDGPEGVTVTAYGGKPGYLKTRTVTIDRASRRLDDKDPNAIEREAIASVAAASKRAKR